MAYVYIPIIQRECDIFISYWNSHRIRHQDDLLLPTGVPNHMFAFPENYGGNYCGIPLTKDALKEVGEVSGLPDENPEIYIHNERINSMLASGFYLNQRTLLQAKPKRLTCILDKIFLTTITLTDNYSIVQCSSLFYLR